MSTGQDLLAYYADLLVKDAFNLLTVSNYVAVDAYFSKKSFIDSVSQAGLHLITRMRDDAVLYYAYTGPQRTGRGRKKQFAGKIDSKNLDLSQFRACIQENTWAAFEGLAYAKALKRWVKTVVVQNYKADGSIKNCKIFIATDLAL
ncbi:MAG: transposase, partial [Spirosomaceae bacterium]|nr:transposase [Spirosomataceae bacterium]